MSDGKNRRVYEDQQKHSHGAISEQVSSGSTMDAIFHIRIFDYCLSGHCFMALKLHC